MERTLFLVLAMIGYAFGGMLAFADAGEAAFVVIGIASVPMLVWIIALGVSLGIRDSRGPQDETDIREAADRWRKARYGDSSI